MPEVFDEIIDETGVLLAELSALRQRLGLGANITKVELATLKRHAARILNMLHVVEVEQQEK